MSGIAVASAIGTALAAASIGAASMAMGHPGGLSTALQHIPSIAPGGSIVSSVQTALQSGAARIGSAISAAAKDIASAFKGI